MSLEYYVNCYCIQNYTSDITASCVHSDKCQQYILWLQRFIVSYFLRAPEGCVLSEQSRQRIWQRKLCNSGNRPEGINHECQPLTLSVWSLGHTLAWRSLSGNELQEAASIIHTYKSTVGPLFLEMRLNERWPYLGSVLLSLRSMSLLVVSTPPMRHP